MLKRDRRMKSARNLLILLAPVVLIAVIVSATGGDDTKKTAAGTGCSSSTGSTSSTTTPTRTFTAAPPLTIDQNATYTANLCTSEGAITLSLDAKTAPVATNNFVFLAKHGFYDGLTFHRAAKKFVIQGGDPKGDGSGGPGYSVKGEVPTDHYAVGALAAAKSPTDAAGAFGSQFFIVTGAGGATLPNDYARFGAVTSGIDVARKIEGFAPASGDGTPTKAVKIIKITITVGSGSKATATSNSSSSSSTTTKP